MGVKRRGGKDFEQPLIPAEMLCNEKGRRIAPPAFILVGLTRFRAA